MAKKKPQAAAQQQPGSCRSRIKEFHPDFDCSQLKPHPNNWRLHPEMQKQLLGEMLGRIGKIDAILAYESKRHGGFVIIDGHQRQALDQQYPVIMLDVTDDEADQILASYNPIAAMAQADQEEFRNLMAQIEATELQESQAIQQIAKQILGEDVAADASVDDVTLKRVDVKPPPKMIWVVVGIPVNEFGSVNRIVEQLHGVPNAIIEMTPSDWTPKKEK